MGSVRHALRPLPLGLLALAACRGAGRPAPPAIRADEPPASVASAEPKKGADAAPVAVTPEEPLRWGTRPPHDGPLYPVLDGRCIHAELWPLEGATLLTYDATVETIYTGTPPAFGIFTADGLSTDAEIGRGFDHDGASFGDVQGVLGHWPDRVVLKLDRSARITDKDQLWVRGSAGWKLLSKDTEGDEGDGVSATNITHHGLFLRGDDVIFEESKWRVGEPERSSHRLRAVSLAEGMQPAPVPALLHASDHASSWESLLGGTAYHGESFTLVEAFVPGADRPTGVLRNTRAGAVQETRLSSADLLNRPGSGPLRDLTPRLGKGRGFVFLATATKLLRYEGAAWSTDDATKGLLSRRRTQLVDAWPDADDGLWLSLEDGGLFLRNADGSIVDRTLPDASPDAGKTAAHGEYVARSGSTISGLLEGDPWAIGRTGALFHWVSGAWQAVALPAPPFARGTYVPESVIVRAPGDVFVNASYAVKEPGWKQPDRYRAILRTRRPREVLRCEPATSVAGKTITATIGPGPPRADDECEHPFVVLTTDDRNTLVDSAKVLATVRSVLRGRAALGGRAGIVEFHSRGRRYLGLKVPRAAEGASIAEAVSKKLEGKPEVVCGEPEAERTTVVDVASGEVVTGAE